jgi:hypothetical protein
MPVNERCTNTEPGAVATGSRCGIHNRVPCKEISSQPPPGRYGSRFRICAALLAGFVLFQSRTPRSCQTEPLQNPLSLDSQKPRPYIRILALRSTRSSVG